MSWNRCLEMIRTNSYIEKKKKKKERKKKKKKKNEKKKKNPLKRAGE